MVVAIRIYRGLVSPILSVLSAPFGLGCRFTPTCSQYALDAVKNHGPIHGGALSIRRLCRCHPWGGSGYDPVPKRGACECSPGEAARPVDPISSHIGRPLVARENHGGARTSG